MVTANERQTNASRLWVTKLTDTSTTDLEGVGTLRWDGDNAFRWVYNATGSATVVGEVVAWDGTTNPNANMFANIYAMATTELGFMAGVCMSICASASYCWIQVFGIATSCLVIENASTVTSVGDYLKGLNGNVAAMLDAATQPLYTRNLQALVNLTSTQAVTSTMAVVVNCL